MADIDRETLGRDIDGLAERMGTRLLEFKNNGALTQLRGQLTRLAERHRQLRNRFEAAQGSDWESTKSELSQGQSDLFEEFVKFEEKLDRQDRQESGRVAGAKSGLV